MQALAVKPLQLGRTSRGWRPSPPWCMLAVTKKHLRPLAIKARGGTEPGRGEKRGEKATREERKKTKGEGNIRKRKQREEKLKKLKRRKKRWENRGEQTGKERKKRKREREESKRKKHRDTHQPEADELLMIQWTHQSHVS